MTSSAVAGSRETIIDLNSIVKSYGKILAIEDVTLKMRHGITGLLGPNGAGKSTLIKILLGLVRMTSGAGTLLGHDVARDSRAIRDQVGYMPEDDCYISGLSGVEMVRFAARLSGLPALEGLRRSHEVLDFCGIEQERYRTVETYSTGMRQKLKFAQSIVHDPEFLILDEPTSGLDPEERLSMLNRIRTLAQKQGKSVLICTHILPDVQELSDDVVILGNGRVLRAETLETLNRPTAPGYTVDVLGNVGEFQNQVAQANVSVRRVGGSSLLVEGIDPELPAKLWGWAKESNTGIRSLIPAKNTLEEVFLDAVRGNV